MGNAVSLELPLPKTQHSSIVISQRYVHPTPARLEKAIDMLEASTISSTAPKGKNASS